MTETDHRHPVLADETTAHICVGLNHPPRLHRTDDCPRINAGTQTRETSGAIHPNTRLCKDCWDMRTVGLACVFGGVVR